MSRYGWLNTTVKWVMENPEVEGCVVWPFNSDKNGYGRLQVVGRTFSPHRLAYEIAYDPIPDGYVVRHSVCDNPACFNPRHLTIGTHADNVADKVAKGRQAMGEGNAAAKLTEEQVLAIRQDPRPQRKLAREYGVSQPAIYQIKHRVTWGHLND